MNTAVNSFDILVKSSILANNLFSIEEVNNLESIKSTYFDLEYYRSIQELLQKRLIEDVYHMEVNHRNSMEYLEVMGFHDQNNNRFAVAIYDTIELEQDPQVIGIFPLG